MLAARVEAADAALRRMLGRRGRNRRRWRGRRRWPGGRPTGQRPYEGRPLFAAHAGLDWPEPPHLVLWHAQTLLREFRGDGHITVLVDNDLDPVEALVMHLASGEVPGTFLRATRAWPDAVWDAGVDRLCQRGLVAPPSAGEGRSLALAERRRVLRRRIEDMTDRLAVHPYEALGEEECAELRTLARPFSRAVVESSGLRP